MSEIDSAVTSEAKKLAVRAGFYMVGLTVLYLAVVIVPAYYYRLDQYPEAVLDGFAEFPNPATAPSQELYFWGFFAFLGLRCFVVPVALWIALGVGLGWKLLSRRSKLLLVAVLVGGLVIIWSQPPVIAAYWRWLED